MLNRCSIALILILGISIMSCGTAPVYQVIDAPVVSATNKHTKEAVRQAIFRAGTRKGWRMKNLGNKRIEGTLTVRKATAKVVIDYDKNRYSIRYKDSENLNYDGATIRDGYNRWIRHLDQQIRVELSGL